MKWLDQFGRSFLAAIVFYTCLPLPRIRGLRFDRLARFAPAIGLLLGLLLSFADEGLQLCRIPVLSRSALVVALWIFVTGGLHFDGAMDTADGLAVPDRDRRLQVMQDSHSGAYGVMAAVVIFSLKTLALSEITSFRGLGLILGAGWGRWGQVMAIALYPYLKSEGKGAFHKQNIRCPQDAIGGFLLLIGISLLHISLSGEKWGMAVGTAIAGLVLAIAIGYWFNRQLGGQTGDTYGAIVEWTETFYLCIFTFLSHW
ncbi:MULTISPECIES: adenosylcobinamide-GDP ribazoletransferase [Spirulina sp. CCY15215]|uniref:adenosylcobinamide-GDP ribazoletransferase n=1 Tax=Spirulina sp. CCY15215 TaxID=2767591 RepID=UPI0032AFF414